eukprot:749071-Hanusia_phi.AAC.1
MPHGQDNGEGERIPLRVRCSDATMSQIQAHPYASHEVAGEDGVQVTHVHDVESLSFTGGPFGVRDAELEFAGSREQLAIR